MSLDDETTMLIHSIEADEWVDGDELRLELRKAIVALPEKQRLTGVQYEIFYDDIVRTDVTEILGTSVGALKSVLSSCSEK